MTAPREPTDIDAVVVTWNSAPHLESTLAAIPEGVRVVVADNGSADQSAAIARRHGATVLELQRNIGFPAAVNAALEHAAAPVVLLLNPDLTVAPGAVERCAEVLAANRSIGVVGSATVDVSGRPEPAAARHDRRALHVIVESLGLVHLSRRLDRQMVHDRTTDIDVDAVNGAFLMIRTDLLRRLGGLDESVFMYLEDQDLCRRVRDAGYRVRYVAGAHAVHEGGASTARGDVGAQARAYLHRIDADVEFLRRYGRRWEPAAAGLAYAARAAIGLVVSAANPVRRARYASALPYALRQLRGRTPAPPV